MGWKARLGTPGCCMLLMRQLQKVQHEVLRLHPRLSSEGAAVSESLLPWVALGMSLASWDFP